MCFFSNPLRIETVIIFKKLSLYQAKSLRPVKSTNVFKISLHVNDELKLSKYTIISSTNMLNIRITLTFVLTVIRNPFLYVNFQSNIL